MKLFSRPTPVILLVILFVFYGFVLERQLYIPYPWIDIPLHFAGGLFVALFFIVWFPSLKRTPLLVALLFIIAATNLVGVAWEFFEWVLDHTVIREGWNQPTVDDTLGDILMVILGSLVIAVGYLGHRILSRRVDEQEQEQLQ